jgi:DNA modification methylase
VRPYYERAGVTIYHGDALEVLPTLPADSVDLIVTDPPYGVQWRSNRRQESFAEIVGDSSQEVALAGLAAAVRCLWGGRHLYTFGRWGLSALPLGGLSELVWDKELVGAGDLTNTWGRSHEYITFGVKANAAQRAAGAGNAPARLRRGSVLRCPRASGAAVLLHPTEKPVGLLRELIESSSRIGETVLDPFVGSGSTLVAARLEGRRAVGVEIEERYCEIAARRLSQDVLPLFEAAS